MPGRYSIQDKVELVKLYYKLASFNQAAKEFITKYPDHHMKPHRKYVEELVEKFETHGTVNDLPRTGFARVTNAENTHKVLTEIENHGGLISKRKLAAKTGISGTSILRILHNELFYPYRPIIIHKLYPHDIPQRTDFASWSLAQIDENPNFYDRIIWTDEAKFHVNGAVNSQTTRMWADSNPGFGIDDKNLNNPGVMVWAGMWEDRIIGPYFFDPKQTVTGAIFKDMLEHQILPQLRTIPGFDSSIFQLDGAPCHFKHDVRDYLDQIRPNKWIGRGAVFEGAKGLKEWPPRSPDLTPLDFYLWGYVKTEAYSVPINNLEDLKASILRVVSGITPAVLRKTKKNWNDRLWMTLAAGGKQFEHLKRKKI